MSSLPPALDFAKAEEEVCDKWAKESTFKTQDRLSEERGDEVSKPLLEWNGIIWNNP
jgi:isoleucyl-tRNA synthetase